MSTQYTEGTSRALVRDDTTVLLPAAVTADVVDRVWEALADLSQGGVVAAVGALTQAAGGLVDVPPFVVAEADATAGTVRVAVRGSAASVTVLAGSGPVEISGAGVLMWSERVVTDAVSVELSVDGPDDAPASAAWPLVGGVVRARTVRSVLDPAREAQLGGAGGTSEADAPLDAVPAGGWPVDAVPAGPAPVGPAPVDAVPVATAAAGGDPEPSERSAGVPDAPDAAPFDAVPSQETLLDAPDDPSDDVFDDAPDGAPEQEPDVAAAATPGRSAGDDVQDADPSGPHDGYEHLFGETVFRGIEDAAVRADGEAPPADAAEPGDESPDDEPAPDPVPVAAPAPTPVEDLPVPVPAPEAGAGVAPQPADPEPGLIAGVPQDVAAPATPPAAVPPTDAADTSVIDDHDGQTIMTSELAALRAAAGAVPQFAAPAAAGALEVLALSCPAGHPNPPTREACRTCGVALEGEPQAAPRPALGRMVVTTSTADGNQPVELDRDVVVGRRPRTSTTSADRMPRMVAVPSPQKDVSRSHVQVTLEEWHVLVEDLATTNGTVLLRPGQQPRRLHPNQKEIVVDGDVLDLGDGVTLTFDGIW